MNSNEQNQTPHWTTSPEAPLEGLIEKPVHLMSEEELRAHVVEIQSLRTSSQKLQAVFRGTAEKEEKEEKLDMFGEF